MKEVSPTAVDVLPSLQELSAMSAYTQAQVEALEKGTKWARLLELGELPPAGVVAMDPNGFSLNTALSVAHQMGSLEAFQNTAVELCCIVDGLCDLIPPAFDVARKLNVRCRTS